MDSKLRHWWDRISSLEMDNIIPKTTGYWQRPVLAFITLFLLVTIVGVPLVFFIWGSFWSTPPGLGGSFTLDGYRSLFTGSVYRTVLNTLIVTVAGTSVAMTIGIGSLVLSLKTNVWGARLIAFILIIQYIIPSYLLAIGWELYAGPSGLINQVLMLLPFVNSPVITVYSLWGIALVTGSNFAGVVYLLSSGAFGAGSSSLEEAGVVSGASNLSLLRKISLKLILPSLVISFVIVFVRVAATFGPPLVLGVPAGIYVVSTHMYTSLTEYPPDFAFATAIGMVILLSSMIGLFLQHRVTGRRGQYATVTGSGNVGNVKLRLGRARKHIGIGTLLFMVTVYIMPVLMVFLGSFRTQWRGFLGSDVNWTLANYQRVILGSQSDAFYSSFVNTTVLGAFGALFAMILATMCSYIIVKGDTRLSDLVDMFTMAPAAFPSIVVGTAYLWVVLTYNDVLGLYGTLASLAIAMTAQFIVYGSRATNASFTTVGDSMEEAARLSGASFFSTLRKVYWPLIKPGFAAGYILLFVDFIKVLTIPILMTTTDNQVLSTLIIELNVREQQQAGAAVAVIMIMAIIAIYALVEFFTDIDATKI